MPYPIRIAYLIESIGSGGAERQLLELATHLDSARFQPRILVWTKGGFFEEKISTTMVPLHRHTRRFKLDFSPVYIASRWLRTEEVDIVHGYLDTGNLYAAAAQLWARKGIALATQRTSERRLSALQRYHKPWTHRQVAATVSNSERGRQYVLDLSGVSPERVVFIPNGIDLDRFHPIPEQDRCALRKQWQWASEQFIFLSVGRLMSVKNYIGLAEAFAELSHLESWRACWIGSQKTEYAFQVRARLEQLGLVRQIELRSPVINIQEAYQAADVLVLASSREGTPNAVLEAMACGRPVIATDVGDVGKYIRDGENGWLLPPDRPQIWPEVFKQVLHTPAEVRRQMGKAARATLVEMNMDVATMVDRHEALYEDLLTQSPKQCSHDG